MQALQFIAYIGLALLILLVMITIHELGHYLAGKLLNFKINEFSIGFGPKLFSRKSKKTGEVFSIRAIPLGGFCAFADETGLGEDEDGKEVFEEAREVRASKSATESAARNEGKKFTEQPPWKRIIVFMAGGVFNLLSAVIFSAIFIGAVGLPEAPVVTRILNSDSYVYSTCIESGTTLQEGDTIVSVNGRRITYLRNINMALANHEGPAEFMVERVSGGHSNTVRLMLDRQTVITHVFFDPTGTAVYARCTETGAALENGDRIVRINEREIRGAQDINAELGVRNPPSTAVFYVERGAPDAEGRFLRIRLVLRRQRIEVTQKNIDAVSEWSPDFVYEEFTGFGFLHHSGFGFMSASEMNRSFGTAIVYAVPYTGRMAITVLAAFGRLVTGRVPLTEISGPVGTVTIMAQLSVINWQNILILLPLLAANLGVFNLLPIPALDGSKIVFASIEWIRKKPINRNVEAMIHVVGMLLLFGFVIAADFIGIFMRCGL